MFNKEAALLKQIADSRESIRRKHLQLKHGLLDIQTNVSKVFQPIIQPLNKMADVDMKKKVEKNFYISTPYKNISKSKILNDSEFDEINHDDLEVAEIDSYEDVLANNDQPLENARTQKFENINELSSENTNQQLHDNDDNNNFDENSEKIVNSDKYLSDFRNGAFNIDTVFGIRKAYGRHMLGNKAITFTNGRINIGEKEYLQTPGLLELIFKKTVDDSIITENDVAHYQQIALDTNLLRKRFEPNTSFKTPTFHKKYDAYLSSMSPSNNLKKSKRSGKGLPKFMVARRNELVDYKYWDNPNELVERLKLLVAERSAGNNNHDNEIQSIIEELREAKIIY